MPSIAQVSPLPHTVSQNVLPWKRPGQVIAGPEMLGRRYEALSRLSRAFTSGTPEDWIGDLTADIQGLLLFDFLEVVIYKKETSEVEWRSPRVQGGKEGPEGETPAWRVFQHQQEVLIADCNADEGSVATKQRLKNHETGYRSYCGLALSTPYRRLGAFGLTSMQPGSFAADDVEFLRQVANQLALAIDNWLAHRDIADFQDRVTQENLSVDDEIRSEMNFEEIVGKSAALRRVLKQVETVAPTGSTVLICGETGTGKELIARAIHNLSPRRSNAFVKLNCAAIPTGLLESELFGHEKGAFTGAVAQRIGRFELANRGTVFLDEVCEIPIELQTKLLRVLQEREFERLGSTRTIQTDARLIAAANRDLSEMVEEQKFRSDLFYRLNVFPVRVPALRERPEDIPLLVRHFVQHFARRMNRAIETIPSETMSALTQYRWPGNIRELQNLIERAVILSSGPVLRVPLQDLPARLMPGSEKRRPQTLEEAEREHILATLKDTKWVIAGPSGAAARLGMNRSTVQFRMKKLGIIRPWK